MSNQKTIPVDLLLQECIDELKELSIKSRHSIEIYKIAAKLKVAKAQIEEKVICECGKQVELSLAHMDEDANWYCQECYKDACGK